MKAFEDHLSKGELNEAREVLNKAQDKLEPSVYLFELARLHAEDNQWPEARIALLKSQKIFPRQETSSNLEMVEKKLLVSEVESPRTIKDYLINTTYFIGSELTLTLNLALLIVGLWNFKKSKNIKSFISILIVMLLCSGLSLWTRSWPWTVAKEDLKVLQGPSEIFDQASMVPKGIKFLGVEKDSWIQIIYPSRFEGWIKKENISEL